MSEVSGNLFFQTKGGFKAHVQVKETIVEGQAPPSILAMLALLEDGIVTEGGKPEASGGATRPLGGSKSEAGEQKRSLDAGDGQCPNGCGTRPWVEAGVSKKTGKPYNAFFGECRTCGFKGR